MSGKHRSKTDQRRRKSTPCSSGLEFESLEDRQLLAFDFLFNGTTLTLNQTVDEGIVTIDNSGGANEFRVFDGGGLAIYEAATNVEINLMDNTNHLNLALNQPHTGDLTINAGAGSRTIFFVSANNEIGGNLNITAGSGEQTLALSQISMLEVDGSVNIDSGSGADTLDLAHPVLILGDLNLTSVNTALFNDGLGVGGTAVIDNSADPLQARFEKTTPIVDSEIVGDFTYIGSTEVDQIDIDSMLFHGDMIVDLGDGITGGAFSQTFVLADVRFDNLTLTSGDTTNSDFNAWSNIEAQENISINMGEGFNSSFMQGTIEGTQFTYNGLSGVDIVGYDLSGGVGQDVSFFLGEGMDNFTLFDGSTIDNLHVDFGSTDDIFNNGVGDFTFDAQLISLDGFDVDYELASDTLSINQRADAISVSAEILSDAVTERFSYGANELTTASNLNLQMADNNLGSLDLYLEHALAGDLNIDLVEGPRFVDFLGSANIVGGNFDMTSGAGIQDFAPSTVAPFIVAGDLSVDLGTDADSMFVLNDMVSGGAISLLGVNAYTSNGLVGAAGDFIFDVSMESEETLYHDLQQTVVHGDMFFYGGDQRDFFEFDPAVGTTIEGNLFADLGDNLSGGVQFFFLNGVSIVNGNVTVLANGEQFVDQIEFATGSVIGGDVLASLGDGRNIGYFRYTSLDGEMLRYISGSGDDEAFVATSGDPITVNVSLGEGNDGFGLAAGVAIDEFLRVDFGSGDDFFNNAFGAFTFDTRLLNWHGFNNFYEPATDSLRVVQVAEVDGVAVDNNGVANAIQLDIQGGAGYEITPATNLSVFMMPNTPGDVAVQLDSPLAGDLILNMQHGDRDAFFVGTTNEIAGNLRIVAGDGIQNLYLAENANLIVLGDTVINTRDGVDTIDDGGNLLTFDDNLILRNVDHFEVSNSLFVGGNMTMVSHWYTQDTRFDNDGTIQIDGKFTFLGSDGSDDVLLMGNVLIGDEIYVDVGDNVSGGLGQSISLTNGFEAAGRLTIQGGTSIGGNNVTTDATTRVAGDMIVDFTGSTTANSAILHGTYGGDYGTFRGGDAADILAFDAVAEDMEWVTLMYGSDDEVSLGTNTNVLSKYLDFGFGSDILDDGHVEEFPMTVLNLP